MKKVGHEGPQTTRIQPVSRAMTDDSGANPPGVDVPVAHVGYCCRDDATLATLALQGDVERLTGLPCARLLGEPGLWLARIHPDDLGLLHAARKAADTEVLTSCEYRFLHACGDYLWLRDEFRRETDPMHGTVLRGWRGDITRAVRSEALLAKLNRALETRRHCDAVLAAADDEQQLLRDYCTSIVEQGGYRLAWIGFAKEDAGRRVQPVAAAGFEAGYMDGLRITWDADDPRGRGPTGTAVRERRPVIVRDILRDPRFAPWRAQALKRGYQSSIALPLILGNGLPGVLNIYADEPDAFDHEEARLLREVADDLAFGLESMRARRARELAEEALRRSEERFRELVGAIPHGVQESDLEGRITYSNAAMHRILGVQPGSLVGHHIWDFHAPEERAQLKAYIARLVTDLPEPTPYYGRNFTPAGEPVDLQVDWTYKHNDRGELTGFISVITDITERKRSQEQLDHLAHHDPLTGLPNRLLFNDRLETAVAHARREQYELAVLFIDIDHFKNINDSLGHPVGDRFLRLVAERIIATLRASDTLARLGGDEFIVLLDEIRGPHDAGVLASKLRDCFLEPFVVDEHELHLTVSIGISLFPRDGRDAATLVRNADAAMYRAKDEGRNDFRFYTRDLTESVFERLTMESALRGALERNELQVHYQPQVNLRTGAVIGAEALLRWQRPGGMVSPAAFIPLAEESGLIIPIGQWVLETATAQMQRWLDHGVTLERLAVNIAASQIQRAPLAKMVRAALERSGLPPGMLELEITESSIMHGTERNFAVLDELKSLGVRLAIDDFGTGYSSLGYLKRMPIDKLKIDQSFVFEVPDNANDVAITRAVIALAQSLGMNVLAEGVETEAQRRFLVEHGCNHGQGYLYSRPLPADTFEDWLRRQATVAAPSS